MLDRIERSLDEEGIEPATSCNPVKKMLSKRSTPELHALEGCFLRWLGRQIWHIYLAACDFRFSPPFRCAQLGLPQGTQISSGRTYESRQVMGQSCGPYPFQFRPNPRSYPDQLGGKAPEGTAWQGRGWVSGLSENRGRLWPTPVVHRRRSRADACGPCRSGCLACKERIALK